MNCTYKYKGKEYTEKEFYKLMNQRVNYLDELEKSNTEMLSKTDIASDMKFIREFESVATTPDPIPEKRILDRNVTISKIEAKIIRLKSMLTLPGVNKFSIMSKVNEYELAKADLMDAPEEKFIAILQQLAIKDLDDSEKLLAKGGLSEIQINNIINGGELWSSLRDLSSTDLDEEGNKIVERASIILAHAVKVAIQYFKAQDKDSRFVFSDEDLQLLKKAEFGYQTVDGKNSLNKLIRYISSRLEQASIKKNLDIIEKTKELKEVLKDLSKKERDSIFVDLNGVTQFNSLKKEYTLEFSKKKYSFGYTIGEIKKNKANVVKLAELATSPTKRKVFEKLAEDLISMGILNNEAVAWLEKAAIEEARNTAATADTIGEEGYKAAISAIYNQKRTWEKENIEFLDPKAVHPRVPEAVRNRLISEFKAKIGNDHYADKIIGVARKKMELFIRDAEDMKEHLLSIYPRDEALEHYKIWNYGNNPFLYYKLKQGKLSRKDEYLISSNRVGMSPYLANAPKADKGHYDPEFRKILNTPKLYKYYTFVEELMRESFNILPPEVTEGTYSGFVYRAIVGQKEKLMSGKIKNIKEVGIDFLTGTIAQSYNSDTVDAIDELGNPLRKIPINKFTNIDSKIKQLQDQIEATNEPKVKEKLRAQLNDLKDMYTLDIESSMGELIEILYHYKYMSTIEDEVKMGAYLANKAKEVTGKNYKNASEGDLLRLDNTIRSIMYKDAKDVEGQFKKDDFFADNVFKSKKSKRRARQIVEKVKAIENEYNIAKSKRDRMQDLTDEEVEVIRLYNRLRNEYKSLGGLRVTGSRIADSAISYTQTVSLGLNPISPFTNGSFGLVSNFIEAIGGEYFNHNTAAKALSIMGGSILNYFSFGKLPPTKGSEKIRNFMEKNNILFDILENSYGYSNAINPAFMYSWLKSSDYFMKGQSTIAAMLHRKIESKNGQISIWDAIDQNGDLDKSKFTTEQIEKWNNSEKVEIIQYLTTINKKIHGNVDPASAIMSKRKALWRMLGQFKVSWLAEGIYNRFGAEREDEILGTVVKGRYRSYGTYTREFMNFSRKTGFLQAIGNLKTIFNNMDSRDKINMRKNIAELSLALSILTLGLLIRGFVLDDDDDKEGFKRKSIMLTLNLMFRLQQDMEFYMSPATLSDLVRDPIPAIAILRNAEKVTKKSIGLIMSENDEDEWNSWGRTLIKSIPLGRPIMTAKMYAEENVANYTNR